MAQSVIDLTAPDPPVVIDLLSDSSVDSLDDEELSILFNKFEPLPKDDANLRLSDDGAETSDDDSSIGIGNSYGDFWPLFDLKRSIAPLGYIDYKGSDDTLSCDSWYLDRCWWLDTPKTSVAPLSWLPPAHRSCATENYGAPVLDPESRICFLLACTRAATERPAV